MVDAEQQPVTLRFECATVESHWEVTGLQLSERFNHPYEMRLDLRSDEGGALPSELLGAPITVSVERGPLIREFSGIVECVEDGVYDQDHTLAILTVVPALMALGQRRNSRIFQELAIPDILHEVLDEGLGAYERSVDTDFLTGDYPVQEYTVQYQETDLEFVHRLMEEYGIGYYFKHEGGVETLVLFDCDSAFHDVVSHGNDTGLLPIVRSAGAAGTREDIREFNRESRLRPTVARTLVFDWQSPARTQDTQNAELTDVGSHNGAELEPEREDYVHEEPTTLFGYRSAGLDFAEVDNQVMLRRKLHQRDAVRYAGMSTVTGLSPATKFELLDHPNHDFDRQYYCVAVEHAAGDYANPQVPSEAYTNRFECLPIEVEWRPDRRTKRPRLASVQTATVVGPAGEEIFTDEHGRIKVQFHWDRARSYDDQASCFIRVVQPWAGKGWGFVFLPRIGMEVVVTFVDGDPDRPIVTGCLYNGDHSPPYLPDDKTKSTIKSESSPGGGGFNELRFEDAAGSEEIYIHAQKDFNEVVLNDHNTTVGNNQTNNVDVDQTQTVHGNQSEAVDGNQDMTVGGDRTVHVKGNFDETVDGTETRTVTGDVSETFAANETRTISGNQDETISGDASRAISGSQTETVSGSLSETITGGITTTTPANLTVTATGGINMTTTGAFLVNAAGGFTVLAPGGTKTVDQDFWKFGGGQGDAFSWQIGIAAIKLDLVGVAMAHTAFKLEHAAVVMAYTDFELTNEPLKIESVAEGFELGAMSFMIFGLTSLC